MNDLEASLKSELGCLGLICVELTNGEVGGNYKVSVQKRDSCSFVFTGTSILVCPSLEVVLQARIIVVIEEDIVLASVSVPPL